MKTVKCIVVGTNPSLEPDFYFVRVTCSAAEFDDCAHYDIAIDSAKSEGWLDPFVPFDEYDIRGPALLKLAIHSNMTELLTPAAAEESGNG